MLVDNRTHRCHQDGGALPRQICRMPEPLQVPRSLVDQEAIELVRSLVAEGTPDSCAEAARIAGLVNSGEALVVEPPPTFAKVFLPDAILAGGVSIHYLESKLEDG